MTRCSGENTGSETKNKHAPAVIAPRSTRPAETGTVRFHSRTTSKAIAAASIGIADKGPSGETAEISSPVTNAVTVAMPGTPVTSLARKGKMLWTPATAAYAGGAEMASAVVTGTTATNSSAWSAPKAALTRSELVGTLLAFESSFRTV